MKFKVVLYETEEGFAVGCPTLPGCWTQGKTRQEALDNIRLGIREFVEVIWEELGSELSKELEENDDLAISMAEVDVDMGGIAEIPVQRLKV